MTDTSAARLLDRSTPPHISTLIVLACISALSMTMFLPALPEITAHFGADYRVMQLSVAIYLLVNAVLQIVLGPISDRYGRRPVLIASLALFILATIGCLFAPSAEAFLAFRMGQAVVVTGMVLSRAIARDVAVGSRAASLIAYVTMGMAIAPLLGPAVGGVLTDLYGWQSNFIIQAAIGAAVLLFCYLDLGETAASRHSSMRQQFAEYPVLFRSRRFWGYCLCAACASGAFFAYLGGAPYVGSAIYGLSASEVGLYIGLPSFGYMLGNFVSGRWSVPVGINRMIVAGSLIAILGPGLPILMIAAGADHPLFFFGFTIIIGFGNGLVMPNATAGMLSVRPRLAGTASGIGGAIMIGGGSGLSALSGALLNEGTGAYPLAFLMLAIVLCGLAAASYVVWVEKKAGPLLR